MAFAWMILSALFSSSNEADIELLECEPPDLPIWGGYGPQLNYYMPGDVIHYYCDVETYIGGNFFRKCLDTGDWNGDTPICDAPSAFKAVFQSTDMDVDSTAQRAIDGIRTTCTETIGGEREEWSGNFTQGGELNRVMLFLPKGRANLEVLLVKQNGDEVVCGRHTRNIDRFDWTIVICTGRNNQGATGLKIRSLTNDPLKICEIQAYVLTSPKCADPHYRIENGRLRLTRRTAALVCDSGYTKRPQMGAKLECIREGEWNRKTLYCADREWDVDDREPMDMDNDDEGRGPGLEPNRNPKTDQVQSV